jgi:hypothetical protein
VAGPYNSLNVGLPKNQVVSTGTDQNNNAVFWDSTYDGRTPGLYEDSGWAPNGTVALKINVKSLQDKCKQNGWQTLVLNGKSFKNQGQCIAYVQSNENSKLHKTVVLENVRF